MSSLLIKNATIITPTESIERGFVLIEGGRIKRVGGGNVELSSLADRTITASGKIVVPGYIDLQANGAKGEEFLQSPQDAYPEIIRFFLEHGTTGMLATVLTDTCENMLQSTKRIAEFRRSASEYAQVVAGVHIEGPYLNPQRRGAHPPRFLRNPDVKEVRAWLRSAAEDIKMVTLAPELEGSGKVIELLSGKGVVVAASHSCADYRCMLASVRKGLSFVTHVGNTTDWPHRRMQQNGWLGAEPGVVGSFLAMEELRGSVILDGFHFHPAMLKPILQCKGSQKVALITDAAFVAGLSPGTYRKGRERVTVTESGYTAGWRKGWLAGSILTMDQAVKNAVNLSGISLAEAVTMATLTPATVLGLAKRKGRIARGYDADLLILDAGLNVELVVCGGELVGKGRG
jgi:N-acetylglucosamine-6-phosphate deacetylase